MNNNNNIPVAREYVNPAAQEPGNVSRCFLWGFFVLLIIIFIIIVVFCCFKNEPEPEPDTVLNIEDVLTEPKSVNDLFTNLKENFSSQGLTSLYNNIAKTLPKGNHNIYQPMVFKKQINSYPSNCHPYTGCFYPSYASNPISLKNGMRNPQQGENKRWCEVSWRDCAGFQDCKNGKCVPKKHVYP